MSSGGVVGGKVFELIPGTDVIDSVPEASQHNITVSFFLSVASLSLLLSLCFRLKRLKAVVTISMLVSIKDRLFAIQFNRSRLVPSLNDYRAAILKLLASGTYYVFIEGSTKTSVRKIIAASALNRLLTLSDGTVFVLSLESLKIIGSTKFRGVTCFDVNRNPQNDDPFSLQVAMATEKNEIVLCEVTSETFKITAQVQTPSVVRCLIYEATTLCFATEEEYSVFDLISARQQPLFPIDDSVAPSISRFAKDEFLVTGMQGLGVFARIDGVSTRPPLLLADQRRDDDDGEGPGLVAFAVYHPYILALTQQIIAVYSIQDQQLKQRIAFSEGRCLANLDGQLFVATKRAVYRLNPVAWDKQVELLLENRKVSDALELAETALNRIGYNETQMLIFQRLKQRAAFIELTASHFDRAVDLMIESELDPRELISLFPDLLPCSSSFLRSSSLHDIPSIDTVTKGDGDSLRDARMALTKFLTYCKDSSWAIEAKMEIATALYKLGCFRFEIDGSPSLELSDELDLDDCQQWCIDQQLMHCLAQLLYHRRRHSDAFDTWRKVYEKTPSETLMDTVIAHLKMCPNSKVVAHNLKWVLKIDSEGALAVLLGCHSNLEYASVVELLREHSKPALLRYLEQTAAESEEANVHRDLALEYVRQCREENSSKSDDENSIRVRFRRFLLRSDLYEQRLILERMDGGGFQVEKAYLMGKMGDHNKAIRVLVEELGDLTAAEDYCSVFSQRTTDRTERYRLNLALVETYLRKGSSDHKTVQIPVERIIDLLNKPNLEIDLIQVLEMLPVSWNFNAVAPFVLMAVRRLISLAHNTCIAERLASASLENKQNECKMETSAVVFAVSESSRCAVCKDIFVESEGLRYPTGALIHSYCLKHKHLCPTTKTLIM